VFDAYSGIGLKLLLNRPSVHRRRGPLDIDDPHELEQEIPGCTWSRTSQPIDRNTLPA
jgi:hypothetical protein